VSKGIASRRPIDDNARKNGCGAGLVVLPGTVVGEAPPSMGDPDEGCRRFQEYEVTGGAFPLTMPD